MIKQVTSRQKRYKLQNDSALLNSNGVDLKLSSDEKILGEQIEENLIWSGHVQYIAKKKASIPLEIKNSNSLDIFVSKCKAWMKRG